MQTSYEMTVSNLAALGLLEEVYDIYKSQYDFCLSLVDSTIDDVIKHNDGKIFYLLKFPGTYKGHDRITDILFLDEIKTACNNSLFQKLYDFFSEYYYFFNSSLPPKGRFMAHDDNNLPLTYCYLFSTNRKDFYINQSMYFGFQVSMYSFPRFLCHIEYLLALAITDIVNPTQETINEQISRINNQIKVAVDIQKKGLLSETFEENFRETLHVYKSLSQISCNQKKHQIIPSQFSASLLNGGNIVLPIHKCVTCGKLFIGENTLKQFSKEYGHLLINKTRDYTDSPDFSQFSAESQLHLLGYNVVDGEMSDSERQQLLVSLIKNGYITYNDAVKDIDKAINIFHNNTRFNLAVSKWSNDLKYIGSLVLHGEFK